MSRPERIAVCLAPGGLPGLDALVGAWMACDKHGIVPAWIGGTSAGAVVGALWASGRSPEEAEGILYSLTTADLVQRRWASWLRLKSLESIYDAAPIERLLRQILPATFGELAIPLRIGATCMDAGEWNTDDAAPEVFACGDLPASVRASLSIAGVWPYATVAGCRYSDGGTTIPYVLPNLNSFDRLIVLNPMRRRDFAERDRNVISRLLWNLEQLQDAQTAAIKDELRRASAKVDWIDLDLGTSSCLEFSPDHRLIDEAFAQADSHFLSTGDRPVAHPAAPASSESTESSDSIKSIQSIPSTPSTP